ncbi:MAG TPA: CHAT domain-containing protein [Thermoanaerobaculia bacterium]|nr:CHAT domain-containing protein [Thermoanaerobaculia bacterium]
MNGGNSQRFFGRTARGISLSLKWGILSVAAMYLLASGCRKGTLDGEDSLTAALAAVRPGEGRLVGAPRLEPGRGEPSLEAIVRKAARSSARALEARVTAETLRNDAVTKLLAGEVGQAVTELTRAAELAPSNATVWSDLAATHLQRSVVDSDSYELVLALAAANRAVNINPDLSAGRFNRALALGRLSLHGQAKTEWEFVSRLERDPLWAHEAKVHAAAIAKETAPRNWQRELSAAREAIGQGKPERVRTIVAGSPQSFREYLEDRLLAEWATAEDENHEPDAARKLSVARAIAAALVVAGGDRMAADTIAQIERTRTTDAKGFKRSVKGFSSYYEGLALASQSRFSDALSRFQEARKMLSREHNPFSHWATYRIALCQYQKADYKSARAYLLVLANDPTLRPYKALQGRALLLTGLIEGIEGRYAAPITTLKAAEAVSREAKEIPYAAKASALLATAFDILGQRKEAWRWLYPALVERSALDKPEIRFVICEYASWMAQREGETEVALWFQGEVVRNAYAIERVEAVVGALRQHAYLLAALGRNAEAAKDLARAWEYLQKGHDPSLHRILAGDLLLAESELAGTPPRQAIARLAEAIRIFRDTSYHYRLGHALYQRALAEKALGQNDAAERDLAAAIAELERQRETVASTEDRISYFDRVKEILDTMIAFQLEQRHRPDEAFRFSEQAKARVLWDWMVARPSSEPGLPDLQPRTSRALDLASIQRDLPESTAVVEYAVLPEKTILWVLHRRGALKLETVEIRTEALSDLVHRLRRALLEDRSAELKHLSEQAYDKLIKPIEGHLAPGDRLVLIPDGALHGLPFSVLRSRQTGRYLIQDRAFAVAPSARVYSEGRRRDRAVAQHPGRVLVVAAPDFDRNVDPSLLALSAADTEASIARIFPGSQVLREGGAKRETFLQAVDDFEMVYFGGHSVVNVDFPLLSQMLFARDPADPTRGVLYSGDLLRLRFPRTRLVVLASCNTALGRISRTEGVENLARPFLAAGVPTVVASLWNVDDKVTADFFVRFHRHLKQRFDVVEALRSTQIESIDQGSGLAANPRSWGAFEVIGGGAGGSPPSP